MKTMTVPKKAKQLAFFRGLCNVVEIFSDAAGDEDGIIVMLLYYMSTY